MMICERCGKGEGYYSDFARFMPGENLSVTVDRHAISMIEVRHMCSDCAFVIKNQGKHLTGQQVRTLLLQSLHDK